MIPAQGNQSLQAVLKPPDQEALMSKVKKTLVRAKAGVKLKRIERLAARQRRDAFFKLTSHRNTPDMLIVDEDEAQRAFAREVAASLEDKVVQGLNGQGAFDH